MKNTLFVLLPAFLLIMSCEAEKDQQATLAADITEVQTQERRLIQQSILDYVEGVYTADTLRIYRSIHPTLVKRGTWFDGSKGDYVPLQDMSFQQLVELTKSWNKDGSQANAQSVREIIIYDVQDKTAAAKLTAVWGTDYFHLAKLDGKWYIMNVLWQSPKPH